MTKFKEDIKPLFREIDRTAMIAVRDFDLWCYDDVVEHADSIEIQISEGFMPCDAPWPVESVELFKKWIEEGKLP